MMPFFLVYGIAMRQGFAHAYMGAHRHAFTVGFISMMIMGVAARVVPILAGIEGTECFGIVRCGRPLPPNCFQRSPRILTVR